MTKNTTQILCTADALSRAADAVLARGPAPSKNAILNALAAAIAGDGHDWGFIKNSPEGLITQVGIRDTIKGQTEANTASGQDVWIVLYDELADWARDPKAYTSLELALDAVAQDRSYWHNDAFDPDEVIQGLRETGHYIFQNPDIDPDDHDWVEPYSIKIVKQTIVSELPPMDADTSEQTEMAAAPVESSVIVWVNCPFAREQDLNFNAIFTDADEARRFALENDVIEEEFEAAHIYPAHECTIMAEFSPQGWQRDYLVHLDPEGEATWMVDADELQPGQHYNDYLQTSRNAPEWVKNWSGPFDLSLTIDVPRRY